VTKIFVGTLRGARCSPAVAAEGTVVGVAREHDRGGHLLAVDVSPDRR
jgi:hypothetical protein